MFGKNEQALPLHQIKKSNSIRTTKYTILSWAPLSILFQFKRAANIYFLIISVLTCLSFSPKSPISMIGTFAAVLIFTMFKEAYEVLERKTNNFKEKKWSNVKIGDILLVNKDMEFPADLLLLNSQKDIVYVDTMNLDGETNLKEKYVFNQDFNLVQISDFEGYVCCDIPNENLDEWDGNIVLGKDQIINCRTGDENHEKCQETSKKGFQHYEENELNALHCFWLLTFWVAYSHLIPISLYVIIEMLKLTQAYLIGKDLKMYDIETEQFGICRNSDLIEELGQVDFIFSDKTGTLTQNKMIFKKCSVGNVIYGESQQIDDPQQDELVQSSKEKILKEMFDNKQFSEHGQQLMQFFRTLAVCHTCMVERDKDSGKLKYSSSSPDELALVQGSKQVKIEYIERSSTNIKIKLNEDETEEYELLVEFPFDSTRKRMTLIVRNSQTKMITQMTKGADSIMIPRINFGKNEQAQVEKDLYKFACEGLRTLVFGSKILSQDDYLEFKKQYDNLKISTDSKKDEKLNILFDEMEYGLNYLGSSAIEDKLQEGVADTIDTLINANIRVWVLTGDKQETAIEIGKSCKLIQSNMKEVVLTSKNRDDFKTRLKGYSSQEYKQKLAIIIDGPTLIYALEDSLTAQQFFAFGMRANSVICCRVSPKQKADVVALAKKQKKFITLSIGDGANDVSMILEAHIGVGIRGKEGTQAVRSADYAISQFRFLERILLVHGRYGYMRVSNMICYYFYKNVVLVFTELHFAYWNGFSGQIFFADWLPTLYNAFFTSWLCLFALMLERDVDDESSQRSPQLYAAGQKGHYFNFKVFLLSLSLLLDLLEVDSVKYFSRCIAAFISLAIYYGALFLLSYYKLSQLIQNELTGTFLQLFQPYQSIYCLIVLPFALLIPDGLIKLTQKIFFPSPSDALMINILEEIDNNGQKSTEQVKNLLSDNAMDNEIKNQLNTSSQNNSFINVSPTHKLLDKNSSNEQNKANISKIIQPSRQQPLNLSSLNGSIQLDMGIKNKLINKLDPSANKFAQQNEKNKAIEKKNNDQSFLLPQIKQQLVINNSATYHYSDSISQPNEINY
ncbi:p-type atpase [Stylonychia lemnae]|uniref:Phospholipid-transporting ATPase n=1 Tax=Stylonychia lemnae TaxID=5949 RepID=A0A078B4W6_STYLE|nr:p-type atpase [Stylonychia lemnae]|eukprot:CDW89464.1 p-type atpase [Stylonychia lemnae]